MKLRIPMPVIRVTRTLTVIYAVSMVGVVILQRPIMFPGWMISSERAAARPRSPGLEDVTVETSDGERLKAFWKQPAPGAPVIVTLHGRVATPARGADRFAGPPWSTAGYGVLSIAYRGYPGSTGFPSEEGLIEDARAAIVYAARRAPESPVVIHGHSMGTGPAVAVAAEYPALALILDAPFTSFENAAAFQFPTLPTRLIVDKFKSYERIGRVKARLVHIVHGTADWVVPFSHGKTLAALRPDAIFHRIDGGTHRSILGQKDSEFEREITGLAKATKEVQITEWPMPDRG